MRIVYLVIINLVFTMSAVAGPEAPKEPDPICQALFQEYIVRSGKVPTEDILAATELIASRGRATGFWKPVLEGLRKVSGWDEIRYVRILGKMLEQDAVARDYIKAGGEPQADAIVYLPADIVPELISRAEKAEEYPVDAYVIALVRARDSRAKDFFQRMLESEKHGGGWSSIKFHAALGLAELGDPSGMQWLITHSDDDSPGIINGRPESASRQNLSSSVMVSLQILSGRRDFKTKTEFEEWWKTAEATWSPKNHVYLVDR